MEQWMIAAANILTVAVPLALAAIILAVRGR